MSRPLNPIGKAVATFARRMHRLSRRAHALGLHDLGAYASGLHNAAMLRRNDRSTDLLHRPAGMSEDLLVAAAHVLGEKVAKVTGHDARRRARFVQALALRAFADLRAEQARLAAT